MNFKHVKYLELEELLQSCYKEINHTLIRDFFHTYIADPREEVNFVINSLEFDNSNIKVSVVRSNASLASGSFRIEAESFREYYDALKVLINSVREAFEKLG